jgi:hypothetical protein
VVREFPAGGALEVLDVSELSSGMYLLALRSAAGDCLVQRVVKL